MSKAVPFEKPADSDRESMTLREAKLEIVTQSAKTNEEFASSLAQREQRLGNLLRVHDVEEGVALKLNTLVSTVTSLILTALVSGHGRKSATVVGEYQAAMKKIEEYHRFSAQLKKQTQALLKKSETIDLGAEDDLQFEIGEAKALRSVSDQIESLKSKVFALEMEIGTVLVPRLSGLIQSQWGEADADLQMAHLQFERAKGLTIKKKSPVPAAEGFRQSILQQVVQVLSEDVTSPMRDLQTYASALNEIKQAVIVVKEGLISLSRVIQQAQRQGRAKGYHENRDSIEKRWHKMNQALRRIDACLDWLDDSGFRDGRQPDAWLKVLEGQLDRLAGINLSRVEHVSQNDISPKILIEVGVEAIPKAEDRSVECPTLPQASKVASSKGRRSAPKEPTHPKSKVVPITRPPKKPQPPTYDGKAAQESADQKRIREAVARREQDDYQDFMGFVNALDALPDLPLTNRDLGVDRQSRFSSVLDSYITLFPEPVKRYLVNTLKASRKVPEKKVDGKYPMSEILVGYFVVHSQSDFEKAFSLYIAGDEPEEYSPLDIGELSGSGFTLPRYEALLEYMFPVVFEKLPQPVQREWSTLLGLLDKFKEQKNKYEAQCATLRSKKNTLLPGNDLGAKRISAILSEIEKENFVDNLKKSKAGALKTFQALRAINTTQLMSDIEAALYDFFGEHCSPKDH